jgi:hypothetical protein
LYTCGISAHITVLDPQGGANSLVINRVNLNCAINFYIGDGAIDEQGGNLSAHNRSDSKSFTTGSPAERQQHLMNF